MHEAFLKAASEAKYSFWIKSCTGENFLSYCKCSKCLTSLHVSVNILLKLGDSFILQKSFHVFSGVTFFARWSNQMWGKFMQGWPQMLMHVVFTVA